MNCCTEDRAAAVAHMTRNEADMAFKRRARLIFAWLPPRADARYLEAGCGRGFYMRMYRHLCDMPLVGVELDGPILAKARANLRGLPHIMLNRADITRLPYAANSFDGVILSEVLEHIPAEETALRELWRVLKPGGRAVITVPNANYPFFWDPINKTLEALIRRPIRRGPLAGIWANHVRLYEADDFRQRVAAAGFAIRDQRSLTHHSLPFIHNLVYGLGKPLLESGLLPGGMANAVDRAAFDQADGSPLNPLRLAVRLLRWFDRHNAMAEPADRTTVNLAILAEKPLAEKPLAEKPLAEKPVAEKSEGG